MTFYVFFELPHTFSRTLDATDSFGRKTNEIVKFGIFDEKNHNFGRKLEISTQFWTKLVIIDGKNAILDKIFRVSLNMLVAQYKINADVKMTK